MSNTCEATKLCTKCGRIKTLVEFSKNKNYKDSLSYECRECKSISSKKYRRANFNSVSAKEKEWRMSHKQHILKRNNDYDKTSKGKEIKAKKYARTKREHPEKIKARNDVSYAIATGKMNREPCMKCGAIDNVDAHHMDYSKPLDVAWLCRKHHNELHNIINEHFKH